MQTNEGFKPGILKLRSEEPLYKVAQIGAISNYYSLIFVFFHRIYAIPKKKRFDIKNSHS